MNSDLVHDGALFSESHDEADADLLREKFAAILTLATLGNPQASLPREVIHARYWNMVELAYLYHAGSVSAAHVAETWGAYLEEQRGARQAARGRCHLEALLVLQSPEQIAGYVADELLAPEAEGPWPLVAWLVQVGVHFSLQVSMVALALALCRACGLF